MLKKAACFSDIHFGCKSNSDQHNQDCIDFVRWFCDNVKSDPSIDHVVFLGDWHEIRNTINVSTLNYSFQGASMLNDLNMPVYFLVGNHDLYNRHNRDISSIVHFNTFANFTIIDTPTVLSNQVLLCPYLFESEYDQLQQYLNVPVWMGHFEFMGFEVSAGNVMKTGPDPSQFNGPKHILSGHFHKRQVRRKSNVIFIGNPFCTNFGEVGDHNKGMATYEYQTNSINFINWNNGPKYMKVNLTDMLTNQIPIGLDDKTRVRCIVDVPISFEESTALRQIFIDKYHLREFTLEELDTTSDVLANTQSTTHDLVTSIVSVDSLVEYMLQDIKDDYIDYTKLVKIYQSLVA